MQVKTKVKAKVKALAKVTARYRELTYEVCGGSHRNWGAVSLNTTLFSQGTVLLRFLFSQPGCL